MPRFIPTRATPARWAPCVLGSCEHGTAPLRRAKPLELKPLARLVEPIDQTTLAGLRDRALLLLGFTAALRRAELVALDIDYIAFDPGRGRLVTIRKPKTD